MFDNNRYLLRNRFKEEYGNIIVDTIIDELNRCSSGTTNVVSDLADLILYDTSKPFNELFDEACESDAEILYYSDAVDFIKEHWFEVEEAIKDCSDSLIGAVNLASWNVCYEECQKYWQEAVVIACAQYYRDNISKTIDIAQFKEFEAYIEDEIRDTDCFDDVIEFIENKTE